MSLDYSTRVFYGTWVWCDSDAGRILGKARAIACGTPFYLPGHPTAHCDLVGCQPTGKMAYTIEITGFAYDPGDPMPPKRLASSLDRSAAERVVEACRLLRLDEVPPIGWHVAGVTL